ncbi:MAG: hypothetical protein E4G74_00385 [Erysipelotrichales bacterium]|nr:MAG: hypothetical protein E4G74_00385 [Erysipelotrichales bacterium]
MENYSVFIGAFFIGLVYFGFVTYFVRKFHFKYLYGLILPLVIVLFFFVMTVYIGQVSTSGWEGLGYVILMILALCNLIGYLTGWAFIALFNKASK